MSRRRKESATESVPGAGSWIADPVRPGDSFETRPAVFKVAGPPLSNPVWVDLFTGAVYEIPEENVVQSGEFTRYIDIPVYDSPCVITERSVVLPTGRGVR